MADGHDCEPVPFAQLYRKEVISKNAVHIKNQEGTMVTTNCQEIAGVSCSVPLSGNSLDEIEEKRVRACPEGRPCQGICSRGKMSPRRSSQDPKQQIEAIWKKVKSSLEHPAH